MTARKTRRRANALTAAVFGYLLIVSMGSPAALAQQEENAPPTAAAGGNDAVVDATTIIYGKEFFERYPNAVSVLDIVRRIPAGNTILNAGNNGNARGFSANDDRILINGKRLSGKANNSAGALGRITVDKLERIEIIRGSSPDIKVSSQESIINIVLNETAGDGSGSWRADGRLAGGSGDAGVGGFLSYGGSFGQLEYFASIENTPFDRQVTQSEKIFDGGGLFLSRLDETENIDQRQKDLTANLTYNFNNGNTLRLNGNLQSDDIARLTNGLLFAPAAAGGADGAILDGTSLRDSVRTGPLWEIGGDYQHKLGEKLSIKFIGLISRNENEFALTEIVTPDTDPESGFMINSGSVATEKIARLSLNWDTGARSDLEIGSEMAINKLDSSFDFFTLQGGSFVEVVIPSSDVLVKETRNESFVVHTFKLNAKFNIESSLFTEYSKIEQTGVGIDRSETFFFLKPSIDFRYNLTKREQVQVSVRRKIEQLNFGDFAASANDDNKAFAGNENLVPEKRWQLEASYEKRLKDDGGRIKLTGIYEIRQDKIELIPVGIDSNGRLISGRGNAGTGRRIGVTLEGSLRLKKLGLPDFLVEPQVNYNHVRITDPFTGQKRRFSDWNAYSAMVVFRHDLTNIGLSYGGQIDFYGPWTNFDVDETTHQKGWGSAELFVEYRLFGGIIVRLEGFNLANRRSTRDRMRFLDGVAGGVLTSQEIRSRLQGRTFNLQLRGTF